MAAADPDAPDTRVGLRALFQPPAWVTGGIGGGDAEFLRALVAREAPATILEIGVAAGTSSSALLYALDQLPGMRRLVSADVRGTCYFNPTIATGAAVAAMYPTPRARWDLIVPATARDVGPQCAPGPIDLVFIDGDHRHPWPLLDVLHLAPWLRPEAWIALHDLVLPRLYPQFPSYGPARVFDMWPGEKVAGTGEAENIGAVRLPADLRTLLPMAQALLASPWEASLGRADVDLPGIFAPLTAALRARCRS